MIRTGWNVFIWCSHKVHNNNVFWRGFIRFGRAESEAVCYMNFYDSSVVPPLKNCLFIKIVHFRSWLHTRYFESVKIEENERGAEKTKHLRGRIYIKHDNSENNKQRKISDANEMNRWLLVLILHVWQDPQVSVLNHSQLLCSRLSSPKV
jgi:hypothetical protein